MAKQRGGARSLWISLVVVLVIVGVIFGVIGGLGYFKKRGSAPTVIPGVGTCFPPTITGAGIEPKVGFFVMINPPSKECLENFNNQGYATLNILSSPPGIPYDITGSVVELTEGQNRIEWTDSLAYSKPGKYTAVVKVGYGTYGQQIESQPFNFSFTL